MRGPSTTRVLVNPRPQAVRLVLSDGTERMVAPWGLTVVPRSDADGRPIDVLEAVLIERRTVPGVAKSP
jgi:hypothetical protein